MTAEEVLEPTLGNERSKRDYKREQERISRWKIYRTTAFYTTFTIIMGVWAIRSDYVLRALVFVPVGLVLWMLSEYTSHRYIFHHEFREKGKGIELFFSRLAVKYLNPMHTGHHERPFDGNHISGRMRDMLPVFLIFAPLTILLLPSFTGSIVVATYFQCYILEEWIHHATHFYNFRDPYFRYMKKHHMYHHTKQGMTHGFGTTSGILDMILDSRFPAPARQRLYGKKVLKSTAAAQAEQA